MSLQSPADPASSGKRAARLVCKAAAHHEEAGRFVNKSMHASWELLDSLAVEMNGALHPSAACGPACRCELEGSEVECEDKIVIRNALP